MKMNVKTAEYVYRFAPCRLSLKRNKEKEYLYKIKKLI
jgi:hypothetical protein